MLKDVERWSLTTLREKLNKLAAKVVRLRPLHHAPVDGGTNPESGIR